MPQRRFVETLSNVISGENCLGGSCRIAFDESLTASSGFADIHSIYGYIHPTTLWLTKSQATLSHSHGVIPVSERSKRLCASCSTCNAEADLNILTAERLARTDVSTAISNIFWKMALTFNSFCAGNLSSSPHLLVEFASLWSSAEQLGSLLPDFCLNISGSIEVLCRIALYAQVQQLLKALIEHNIVAVNQTLDDNATLLQMACLARNMDAVQYLISVGADVTFQESHGTSPSQASFCTKVSELLATATSSESPVTPKKYSSLTIHDKQTVFNLATSSSDSCRLLLKLQTVAFNINRETDGSGDYLVHILVKAGLVQLPLLLLVVKQFKANIDLCNVDGYTCLMLASSLGDCMLVDILICVLGADIDATKNSVNGWSALHYACYGRHTDVVEVLLKRGANFDSENNRGFRADELATVCRSIDCSRLVTQARLSHIRVLRALVQQDRLVNCRLLRHSDLFAVDEDGLTLLMMASKMASLRTLKHLLKQKDAPLNAQHNTSLRTALIYATVGGHSDVVRLLLENNADPLIQDVDNMIAIYYAVLNNDIITFQTFVQFPTALKGLHAAIKRTTNEEVRVVLQAAIHRRQREIVMPKLFELAASGDVDGIYCLLEDGDDVNPVNDVGDWPLYLAVQNADFGAVKLLHQWKGDITSRHTNDNGNTVLHVCCHAGNLQLASFLLTQYKQCHAELKRIYSDLPVNLLNATGFTPLMIAASQGHIDLVNLLLQHGASPIVLRPTGELYRCRDFLDIQQVLDHHQNHHARQVFDAISDKKAGLKQLKKTFLPKHDHNLRDPQTGDSPLMRACFCGRVDVIKFLLESATYPLISIDKSWQPCESCLRDQCDQRVSLSVTDGSTAYHRAVENGDHVSVVDCLLSSDESAVNERNAMGLTPLHLACKLNRSRTAKKLICPNTQLFVSVSQVFCLL